MAITEFQRHLCRLLAETRIASGESYLHPASPRRMEFAVGPPFTPRGALGHRGETPCRG